MYKSNLTSFTYNQAIDILWLEIMKAAILEGSNILEWFL